MINERAWTGETEHKNQGEKHTLAGFAEIKSSIVISELRTGDEFEHTCDQACLQGTERNKKS